ncbi:MAG: bifunctional phosphoglucose/phosphomannose isomerase [Thermoleophilaceae bacterium]|nr:bifunctional phosphoglucose/phosphomannose isomerase [Thermoleophilaceae bacterium]
MSAHRELSAAAVASVDHSDLMGDVLDLPAQLEDALWRVEAAGLPRRDAPEGLVLCGMGGSAVGGELAVAATGRRARRPLRVSRDYELDPWIGAGALVLCSSYSGYTEETLACFAAAGAVGASRVALTTGGALADSARAEGVPVIGVPSGLQPRAAVAYTTVGALECVAACGAGDPPAEEVRAAGRLLETLIEEWGPDAPEGSEAKTIARGLAGALPVVYGAGATVAAARRWKSQLNENAKLPSFASVLPEADHNELIGYERARGLAPLHAVFLGDEGQRSELRRRLELTAEVVEATRAAGVTRVEARGDTALERLLSLVLLGDLVSVYLAVLAGVDPTSVLALESFKERLAEP